MITGNKSLIIRDSDGNIVFNETFPSDFTNPAWTNKTWTGEKWPAGKMAAMKAWEVAPLGSIEIERGSGHEEKILLYGFRELWKWGVDNAGFPPLE